MYDFKHIVHFFFLGIVWIQTLIWNYACVLLYFFQCYFSFLRPIRNDVTRRDHFHLVWMKYEIDTMTNFICFIDHFIVLLWQNIAIKQIDRWRSFIRLDFLAFSCPFYALSFFHSSLHFVSFFVFVFVHIDCAYRERIILRIWPHKLLHHYNWYFIYIF